MLQLRLLMPGGLRQRRRLAAMLRLRRLLRPIRRLLPLQPVALRRRQGWRQLWLLCAVITVAAGLSLQCLGLPSAVAHGASGLLSRRQRPMVLAAGRPLPLQVAVGLLRALRALQQVLVLLFESLHDIRQLHADLALHLGHGRGAGQAELGGRRGGGPVGVGAGLCKKGEAYRQ